MFETILHYSSFACGIIQVFFAILHLSYRKKEMLNYLSACLFFSMGCFILYIWSFMTGGIFYAPWLLYSDLAATFFIAPVIYFFVSAISGGDGKLVLKRAYHFVPAVLCFFFFIVYNLANPSIVAFYRVYPVVYPDYNLTPVITTTSVLADFWLVIYLIASLKNIHELLKNKNNNYIREMQILKLIIVAMTLSCSLLFIAHIIKNDGIVVAFLFMSCFFSTFYYIYSIRHPEFGHRVIKEAKRIRYENSLPESVDVKIVMARLKELLEVEKIFRDDELSLSKLSAILKITSHQLSQIINKKTGMNFRGYMNSYRIEEAKRLLLTEPDMSILEIAFSVGFNSKPTFNALFLRETGLTPRDYKKQENK